MGHKVVSTDIDLDYWADGKELPVPPFHLDAERANEKFEPLRVEMVSAVNSLNEAVKTAPMKHSLQSSLGEASCLGGFCLSDSSFSGLLTRYFTEMLPEDIVKQLLYKSSITWIGRAYGIASHHRSMRKSQHRAFMHPQLWKFCEFPDTTVESYVREEDLAQCENIHKDCATIVQQTKSMGGLLVHLENLGHVEPPFGKGLNVELLPFQRQTLQWALERETIPGGIEGYLWARLPAVEDSKFPNVYYSPILDKVKTNKPKLVRGGIIADETGLGKTVRPIAFVVSD